MEGCEKQIKDLKRKSADSIASAANMRVSFMQACEALGVDASKCEKELEGEDGGATLRNLLLATVTELDGFMAEAVQRANAESVEAAFNFYADFMCFTIGDDEGKAGEWCVALRALRGLSDAKEAVQRMKEDEYRQGVLTDLLELQAFLLTRQAELTGKGVSMGDAMRFSAAPASVQRGNDADTVGRHLKAVEEVVGSLRHPRVSQLMMISKSERYVDRMVASVSQHIVGAKRLESKKAVHEARMVELQTTIQDARVRLQGFVNGTKQLKLSVEHAMSQEYQRTIHIFGEGLSTL
jgi:hypothetical protein